jgi:hypothetical protein
MFDRYISSCIDYETNGLAIKYGSKHNSLNIGVFIQTQIEDYCSGTLSLLRFNELCKIKKFNSKILTSNPILEYSTFLNCDDYKDVIATTDEFLKQVETADGMNDFIQKNLCMYYSGTLPAWKCYYLMSCPIFKRCVTSYVSPTYSEWNDLMTDPNYEEYSTIIRICVEYEFNAVIFQDTVLDDFKLGEFINASIKQFYNGTLPGDHFKMLCGVYAFNINTWEFQEYKNFDKHRMHYNCETAYRHLQMFEVPISSDVNDFIEYEISNRQSIPYAFFLKMCQLKPYEQAVSEDIKKIDAEIRNTNNAREYVKKYWTGQMDCHTFVRTLINEEFAWSINQYKLSPAYLSIIYDIVRMNK